MKNPISSFLVFSILFLSASGVAAQGGIAPVCASLTAGNLTYSQNFNSLGYTGNTATQLPIGIGFAEAGSKGNSTYGVGNGSNSAANVYSYGKNGSTERAFGQMRENQLNPIIGGCLQNNTGATLSSFTFVFDGEMWRRGQTGPIADQIDFQYSTTASSLSGGTWTDQPAGDFFSPQTEVPNGATDGDSASYRTLGITATVSGLSVANGSTFYFRWIDASVNNNEDGLAIDNLSITAASAATGTIQFHAPEFAVTEDHGTATISVSRLNGSSGPASVSYATSNGTAINGAVCNSLIDYVPTTGTLSWANGDSSDKTFNITVCNNAIFEPTNTVNLTLSNVSGSTMGSQGTSVLSIYDTDLPPTVSFAESLDNTPEGSGIYNFVVERSGASGNIFSVDFAIASGSAAVGGACGAGIDVASSPTTVTFQADEDVKLVPVLICQDQYVESDERFTATLSGPTGAAVIGAFASQSVDIQNDDNAGFSVVQTGGTTSVDEVVFASDTDSYTLVLTSQPNSNVTIDITSHWDLVMDSTSFVFTPANWYEPQTVTIHSTHDTNYMGTHYSTISHSSTSSDANYNGIAVPVVDVTIEDTRPATLDFASAEMSKTEHSGYVDVEIKRTGILTNAVSVDYSTLSNTATAGVCGQPGADFETISGTLTFGSNETSKAVRVPICKDDLSEDPAETFYMIIENATGDPWSVIVGNTNALTITILDSATEAENLTPIITTTGSPGDNYPSPIDIGGYTTNVTGIRVSLYGVTQTTPDDLDVLLVAPDGSKMILMADTGGSGPLINATITFDDSAILRLPDNSQISEGQNYRPSSCGGAIDEFPTDGTQHTSGPYILPGCSSDGPTLGNVFGGKNPNGRWRLYVRDHQPFGTSGVANFGAGSINAWGIQIVKPTAADASISGRVTSATGDGLAKVDITVSTANGGEPVILQTNPFGYYGLKGLATGQSYIISVDSKQFKFEMPERIVVLQDSAFGIDFIALPRE